MARHCMTDYDKEWKDLLDDLVVTEDGKVNENDIPSYTLTDTITLDDITFTSDSKDYITINSTSDTFTLTNDIVDFGNVNVSSSYSYGYEAFRDCLPSLYEVESMCKEYPALQKAYENFRTIYKMVEQDYKGKQDDS